MLVVTGEEEAAELATWQHARFMPTHTLSIGGLNSGVPSWWGLAQQYQQKVLRLNFDDVEYSHDGYEPASPDDVRAILGFLSQLPPDADVLIHCAAGISRSTACAWLYFALRDPGTASRKLYLTLEKNTVMGLRDSASHRPNRQIIWLASRIASRPDWRAKFRKNYIHAYKNWDTFRI